jgi:hypothetical protein
MVKSTVVCIVTGKLYIKFTFNRVHPAGLIYFEVQVSQDSTGGTVSRTARSPP